MPDSARAAADNETPVNPYSLLEAVNNSSDTAHTAWLIFIGIMAYLMVAVAGVTHKDLLLETAVSLPILQVDIQLAQFFRFAPIMLVLFHLGLISQLVLLARKTLEFDASVRELEVSNRRNHPLRLELHNFFFVQAIAGPHRSVVMSVFLHGMSWLTLVVLPVVLLLYIQISFLPYHDVAITWTHRIALGFDILMLVLIGIFLTRAETSFFTAFWRTTLQHPLSFLVTTGVLTIVSFFSFFVATVPGEELDRLTRTLLPQPADADGRGNAYVAGFTLPYISSRADGTLWGVFHRNLSVTDQDLVTGRGRARQDEPSISLRGRDLRYARLDRTDLNRVDFTGAALDGASFVGADLSNARLQCGDVSELILSEDRKRARCTSARDANFTRAKLTGARMAGVDLRGAQLEESNLENAELAHALLVGTNFAGAHLEKADLTGGIAMQGANFLIASLQGADLTGAHAEGTDFSSAGMQATVLTHARLQGASLRDADLEGANLQYARLLGADLTGAKLPAADLRGAAVWQAKPPPDGNLDLADLESVDMTPPVEDEIAGLQSTIEQLPEPRLRSRLGESLQHVVDVGQRRRWETSPERQKWHLLVLANSNHQPDYPVVLTEHLLRLMCHSRWANGAVATGVAKRAQAPQFRGDIAAVHDRLKSQTCPASKTVLQKPVRELTVAVDSLHGN